MRLAAARAESRAAGRGEVDCLWRAAWMAGRARCFIGCEGSRWGGGHQDPRRVAHPPPPVVLDSPSKVMTLIREHQHDLTSPLEGFKQQLPDADPQETAEWIEALDGVVESAGPERAYFL